MEDATSPATTNSTRSSGRTLANLSPDGQGKISNNSSSSTITETSPLKKEAIAICEDSAGSAVRGCMVEDDSGSSRRPTLTSDVVDDETTTTKEADTVGQKVEQILFRAKQQLQVSLFYLFVLIFEGVNGFVKTGWLACRYRPYACIIGVERLQVLFVEANLIIGLKFFLFRIQSDIIPSYYYCHYSLFLVATTCYGTNGSRRWISI